MIAYSVIARHGFPLSLRVPIYRDEATSVGTIENSRNASQSQMGGQLRGAVKLLGI